MKKIYSIIVATVVFSLLILPDAKATLTLKINNNSNPSLATGCVGTDLSFIGSVTNNPPALPYTFPTPRWTGSGAIYLDNPNNNIVTFNCPTPGDYQIIYSAIKSGVTYTVTQNIKVINRDVLVLDQPTTVPYNLCEGSSVTMQASGTTDYYWEREQGATIDPVGVTASVTDTPPSTGTWTYRVYGWNDGCSTSPDKIEFQVIVDQAPTVNTGGPYTTCYGTPIALNGSIGGSASSAQWIGGAGTFNPNRNTLNATYTPALSESGTSVSLTLRTDDPAGVCSYAESITTLTVNPLPAAITGTANVCVGLTTTLADATPGGSWSSATPAVATIDAGGIVTAVSAGTSVISYTLPTGCFVTRTVTVNPLPAAITGTTNVCVSSTTTLSNTTPGGAWSSATPAVATINSSGVVTGVSAGTSVISYTLPTGCKEVVTVTVNPLPAAITGTLVVCAGSTTTLANATPGGTWSSASPAVATINSSGVVTGVSGGSSVISYTLPTGCSSTATVTVNPLPAVITGTTTVCVTMTTTLSNATPGGTWSSASPAVATINSSGVVTGVSAGTSVISYTLPTGCSRSVTVTVNSMPSPITGTTSICLGGTTTLANATPGGTWSSATPAVATIDAAGVVTSVSAGTSVISYTLASGCSTSVTVTVNPLPAAITGTTTVCAGSTTQLNNATPGGVWSSATTSVATINATGLVTGVASGTSVISYTLPTGCKSTTTVTVNPLPAAITGTTSVCIGSTTTFACTTPGGTWSSATPAVATIDASGVITGVTAGTSVISYTLPTGCARTRTVTVVALPTITLGAVSPVCQDATNFSLPYTATTGTPTSYSISAGVPALAGFTPVVDASMVASPLLISIPGGSANGIYQFIITVKNATGCVSTPKTFNLTINPLPAAITGTTAVCVGSTTTLANATPGGTWSSATPAVATISAGGVVTGVSAGTSVISYTLGTGCKVTTTVTVNPLPAAITGTTNVCVGSTTTLANTTPGGTWSSATPAVATITAGGVVTGVSVGTSVISYTLPTSCSISTTVTVNALPTITLGTVNAVCKVASSFSLPYTVTTGSPTTYSISAGTPALTGFVPVVNAALGASPLSIPIPVNSTPGTYQFTVTVRNGNGCVSTSQNFNLTINDLPTVTFGGILATQCITSTTYALTGGLPVGGTYSGPGVTGTNFNASVAGAGTHTITYTYNDVNGCSASATNTITVNPSIGNNIISSTKTSICYNSIPVVFTGTTPTGGSGTYTYQWESSIVGAGGPFSSIAGETSKDYTPTTPITVNTWYRRVVTSAPCSASNSNIIQITVGPVFTATATSTSPKCVGSPDGTATAVPVGGTPAPGGIYTYSWNTTPVQTTKTAIGLIAGTYIVTVTDNIGCTTTATATITDPTPITLGAPTITDVTGCFGNTNGAIQIQAAGGSSPYKYDLYNNGAFVSTQSLASGTPANFTTLGASTQYEVRVTDANNCGPVISTPITITQPAQLKIDNVAIANALCYGETTGTITITASGGTVPYTYSIDGEFGTYSSTNPITVASGDYDIWVKDANGCTASWGTNVFIDQPEEVLIDVSFKHITQCFGDMTGQITINPNRGALTDYDFTLFQTPTPVQWVASNDFTGLAAGNYYPQAKNKVTGCISTYVGNPVVIQEPQQITFNVVSTNVTICWNNNNGTIKAQSISGGAVGAKQVSIDNTNWFASTYTFSGLAVGTYTVYVKDTRGCIAQKTATITGPTPITLVAPPTVVDLTCNGVIPADGEIHVVATGGTGALTYSLDGGAYQATGDFLGLTAGVHNLDVKDANNCIFNQPITVNEPPAIVFNSPTSKDISCFGLIDGEIHAAATGGTGALTYTLLPAGVVTNATGDFLGLSAGTYSVNATDTKGCFNTTSNFTIIEPALFTFGSATFTPLNCNGDNSTITLVANGGTDPKNYTITDGGAFTQTNATGIFNNIPAGNYNYTIIDANSCNTFTGPIIITQPAPIVISTPVITQMTGPSANDGKIKLNATGGTGLLTFTLNPGGVVLTAASGVDVEFTGLAAGTYTIDVTDANGCIVSVGNLRIGLLDLILTPTDITCNGLNNGQIVLTINSGTAPYTITWSGPSGAIPAFNDMLTITGLSAGLYTVNVTDAIGVTGTASVTINEPAVFAATWVSTQDKLCFGDANGSVTFNITGGTAPYTIAWTEGTTPRTEVVNVAPYIATNVAPGTYDFTITDAGGCGSVVINSITLVDPQKLNITDIIGLGPNCNGEVNGSITVTAVGGTAPLNYTITGPVSTSVTDGIFNNLLPGDYTVALTDANGCVASSDVSLNVTLVEPLPLQLTFIRSSRLNCPNEPVGYLRPQVSGGTPNYTYLWSNGQNTPDLENVIVGEYSVLITDEHGCTITGTDSVRGPKMFVIVDKTVTDAKCSELLETADDVGSIKINSASGGTAPYAYRWHYPVGNPVIGDFIDKLSAGKYFVTTTDANNCTYLDSIIINSDPDYFMDAWAYKDTMMCGSGTLNLVAIENGINPARTYTYSWYEAPNTSGVPLSTSKTFTVNPTKKTKYYLEIRNDGGCFSNDTAYIEIYPKVDMRIPPYISALQQNNDPVKKDTIIAILSGSTYNLDVLPQNTDYAVTFNWEPEILFDPADSWNSSIYTDKEIYAQIPANRIVTLTDPQTKSKTKFILIDVKAVTEKGCKDSLRLYAKIINNVAFGNVFSPNDDGLNDRWEVPRDYLFPDLSIEIFDRWGARVWSASGDKAARGWDGRTDNGKELPIGTYYYVVKFNANTSDKKWEPVTGSVTIVR